MARPVVAIIGRPNVGKSTLVNRLCRSREAIVHDEPGVTRDRTYQDGYWGDREFKVVDTGGLVFDDDSEFLPEIREQASLALEEASVALVIVDDGFPAAAQPIHQGRFTDIGASDDCDDGTRQESVPANLSPYRDALIVHEPVAPAVASAADAAP